jgi:hypothetical protein
MVPISGLPCFLARWVVVRVSRQWNWRRRVVGLRWGREARGREKALNLQWSTWSGEAGGERAVGTFFFERKNRWDMGRERAVGTWNPTARDSQLSLRAPSQAATAGSLRPAADRLHDARFQATSRSQATARPGSCAACAQVAAPRAPMRLPRPRAPGCF